MADDFHKRTGKGKRGVRCFGCGKRPGAGNVRCDPCAVTFIRDWKASPEDNRRAAERIGRMLPRW